MPEFQLDHGDGSQRDRWKECDAFTQGYIEAMFFTETGDADDGDLQHATVADLAPETWDRIKADCDAFKQDARNAAHLEEACAYDYEMVQAGRDFWFTRNGHGVGFWDRKELNEQQRDALSDAARATGSRDLYRGDDKKLYLM